MKNKGFTLIELLAVIVILAIIALIATPIILNIIEDARLESYKRSIDMYGRASENAVAHYQLKGNGTPRLYEQIKDYIEYDGARVSCEVFVINENGTIYLSDCSVGGNLVKNYTYGELLAIKEGTLAYDILEKNGGIDSIERLNVEWKEGTPNATTEVATIKKTDAIYFADDYNFDSKTGEYSLAGNLVKATVEECRTGVKTCGKYTFKSTKENFKSPIIYEVTAFTNTQADTANYFTMTTKEISAQTLNNEFANSEIKGLYKATDDLGVSYYFKGDATNNYVKFGKWNETDKVVYYELEGYEYPYRYDSSYAPDDLEKCISEVNDSCHEKTMREIMGEDIYWKIVRINGDGTIRLIYSGTEKYPNYEYGISMNPIGVLYIGNPTYNNNGKVDYTYQENGIEKDSDMKIYLESWYEKNLKKDYGKYIADAIYCNDRTIIGEYYDLLNVESDAASDSSAWFVKYAGANRYENKTPILTCKNIDDRYSVSSIGNGKLKYPIGLLTMDELMLRTDFKLSSEYNYFWTITPHKRVISGYTLGSDSGYIFVPIDWDNSNSNYANHSGSIVPVINLKADVKFKGDGSIETPYEIVME